MNLSDDKITLAAHVNVALRMFFRLGIDEKPPHPTTLQKFRFNRLGEGTYLKIHFKLLGQAEEPGLLIGKRGKSLTPAPDPTTGLYLMGATWYDVLRDVTQMP